MKQAIREAQTARRPYSVTTEELLKQYALTVARLYHSSEEDPVSDELDRECQRLEEIGALRGHAVSDLMGRIMNGIMNTGRA